MAVSGMSQFKDGFDVVDDGFVHGYFLLEMKKPTSIAPRKWTHLGRQVVELQG